MLSKRNAKLMFIFFAFDLQIHRTFSKTNQLLYLKTKFLKKNYNLQKVLFDTAKIMRRNLIQGL